MKSFLIFAMALLGAVCSAWAAKPVVVWDGDFATKQKGGFTLDLAGHTKSADDDKVTIAATPARGVKISWTNDIVNLTVLVKHNGLPAYSRLTTLVVLASAVNANRIGVNLKSGGDFGTIGYWNGSTKDRVGSNTPMNRNPGVFALKYKPVGNTVDSDSGTRLVEVVDGAVNECFYEAGLKSYNEKSIGLTVGGNGSNNSSNYTGFEIAGIAIFDSVLSDAEIAAYQWPSEGVEVDETFVNAAVNPSEDKSKVEIATSMSRKNAYGISPSEAYYLGFEADEVEKAKIEIEEVTLTDEGTAILALAPLPLTRPELCPKLKAKAIVSAALNEAGEEVAMEDVSSPVELPLSEDSSSAFFKVVVDLEMPQPKLKDNTSVMIAVSPFEDGLCNTKWEFCKTTDFETGERQDNQYRIPGVSISDEGEVVAVYDCRYMSDRDLGWNHNLSGGSVRAFDREGNAIENIDKSGWEPIDIAGNISLDRGKTWTKPEIFIDVPNSANYEGRGEPTEEWRAAATKEAFDIGDPVIQYDPKLNRFWCMGITGGGLHSPGGGKNNDTVLYWRDGSKYAADKSWHEYVNPDGVSGRSIKQMVLDSLVENNSNGLSVDTVRNCKGIFQGPGQGMVTSDNTVVLPMQWFGNDGSCYDFAIYGDKDENGNRIWKSTGLVIGSTQEPQIVELDDGSWLMMTKGYANGKRRYFRTVNFKSWTEDNGGPGGQTVQGSIVKLGLSKSLGRGLYATVFDRGNNRSALTLTFGKDVTEDKTGKGIVWNFDNENYPDIVIFPGATGGKGYNSLVMLDDHTLGILYEANNHIYFHRLDVSKYLK